MMTFICTTGRGSFGVVLDLGFFLFFHSGDAPVRPEKAVEIFLAEMPSQIFFSSTAATAEL